MLFTLELRKSGSPPYNLGIQYNKPINSDRYLNDCQEFIFHFTPRGATPLDRLALGVPYQDQSSLTRWRGATAIGRTRRPFPRSSPNSACGCTACRGLRWPWTPSAASGARRSPARGSA